MVRAVQFLARNIQVSVVPGYDRFLRSRLHFSTSVWWPTQPCQPYCRSYGCGFVSKHFEHEWNGACFLFPRPPKSPPFISPLQHFLANSGVSRSFAEILLSFLVGKLKEVVTRSDI